MKTKPEARELQNREGFLDLLRIFACFLVVVNHTAPDVFLPRSPQEGTWFLAVGWFFFSKPAVLLFYMISGYLLLGRQDSWQTAWKRIRRMLWVILLCAAIYGGFHWVTGESEGFAGEFLQVFREPPSNALWYLYTYLGLLIMLPFLQKMAGAMEKKDYYIFFGLSCAFYGSAPILAHYSEALSLTWYFQLPLFSNAVAMLFAGHYFARFGVKKKKTGLALAAVLVLAMAALNTYATWVEYQANEGSGYLFFDNRELLPNMLAAICLFYLASFVRFSPAMGKAAAWVGGCTFGMYLIGDLLLTVFLPIRKALEGSVHVLLAMAVHQLLVFACSFLIIAAVRRIPWVRKLI